MIMVGYDTGDEIKELARKLSLDTDLIAEFAVFNGDDRMEEQLKLLGSLADEYIVNTDALTVSSKGFKSAFDRRNQEIIEIAGRAVVEAIVTGLMEIASERN